MSVVTRIGPEAPGIGPEAPVGIPGVSDLQACIDDRTRALLGRRSSARRGWLIHRGLLAADLIGLSLAFVTAVLLYGASGAGDHASPLSEYLLFLLTLPVWTIAAKLHGLYDQDEERAAHSGADEFVGVFHLVTIGAWALLVGSMVTGIVQPEMPKVIGFWALAIVLVPAARALARSACRRSSAYTQNTLILGAGDVGQLLARKLIKHPEYGINVVGFVDRSPKARREDLPDHLAILGSPERLPEIVRALDVERVIVAFSNEPAPDTLDMVRELGDLDVQVDLVPRLYELVGPKVGIHTIEGLPLIGLPSAQLTPSSRALKRAIDVAGAAAALAVTSPLFAYIALRIRRDSAGPVFFRQTRLGYGGCEFTALKFRTMKLDTDDTAHREYIASTMSAESASGENGLYKLDRSDAVTAVGHWLRKTSLDELPQLINVLRGDMSLVGPRPCIPYETEHFRPHQFERFLMPQGITGLWQVTARANSTFGEALDMDVAYVRGWSIGLDLRLLVRTPLEMLRQRAATA